MENFINEMKKDIMYQKKLIQIEKTIENQIKINWMIIITFIIIIIKLCK